jgi:hypothetical protein
LDISAETGTVSRLAAASLGEDGARLALAVLDIDPRVAGSGGETVSRAEAAMALNLCLFAGLLDAVPTARRYVEEVIAAGERLVVDHGALRTIDGPTGALPSGRAAFARILEPLGYEVAGEYPLPRLTMTGRAYAQADFPEIVPQFFVSELHMDQLPAVAQAAGERVFGTSRDPLGEVENAFLSAMARDGETPFAQCAAALPGLVAAFGRQHPDPALTDYEALLPHTAEGAWIATEGNAFNHATNRVADVEALAADLKARGYPVKAAVEHSANGQVHQTALIADKVMRQFRDANGDTVTREVPGSFFEFITRDIDATSGGLDLTFDSGNATGIFAVTRSA